jgi:hypothetical protein
MDSCIIILGLPKALFLIGFAIDGGNKVIGKTHYYLVTLRHVFFRIKDAWD